MAYEHYPARANTNFGITVNATGSGRWGCSREDAQLCVLMDIRAELQKLNALLHCQNFQQIPRTLKKIDARLGKTRKLAKGRSEPRRG